MYVLVLVEHGVKLRIARQRAAARRTPLPSLLDVGASQLRTPGRTSHAAPHATSTLWKAGKALNVTQFHDFVCRLWKRRREGSGSSVQRCTMGQKCKFFTKNLHSLLEKELTYIMKHCYSNLEDCRFKPRMVQGSIHEWHWHWNLWHGLSMSVFSVYQQ